MPGKVVLHFAEDAANRFRSGHLGIECLDLRRTALEEEEDHGLIGREAAGIGGPRPPGQQTGKAQPSQGQAADAKELTPATGSPVGREGKHRLTSQNW